MKTSNYNEIQSVNFYHEKVDLNRCHLKYYLFYLEHARVGKLKVIPIRNSLCLCNLKKCMHF